VALLARISSPRHEHTTTIPARPANDPRQHARQRRALARCVLLAVPPPGDLERGPLARPRAGAIVRPAHGVHPVRDARLNWRERPAGLKWRWHCAVAMNRDRRRALRLLAGDGLATATPETVHAAKRPIEVVRVRITDAGRLALAG
jgi:hypothetical protein